MIVLAQAKKIAKSVLPNIQKITMKWYRHIVVDYIFCSTHYRDYRKKSIMDIANNNSLTPEKNRYFLKKIALDIFVSLIIVTGISIIINIILSEFSIGLPPNLIGVISILSAFCMSSYYLHLKYPLQLKNLGVEKENLNKLLIGGIMGGAVLLLINNPFRDDISKEIIEKYLVDPNLGYLAVAFFLLIVVIFVPLIEEIFYRGFIFRIIKNGNNNFWAFIVSSALFSIGHSLSLTAFLSSLILCYLFQKTNIIGPCILAHALWNLVWFSVKYQMTTILSG